MWKAGVACLSVVPTRRVLEQAPPAWTICYANAEITDTSQEQTARFVTTKGNSS